MSSSSTLLSSSASYMDRFAYHLAEKLLGGNDNDHSPLSFPPTNAAPKDPSFHSPTSYYRANWRSEAVELSHDLFSPIRPHDVAAAASPNEPLSSETQTIFVDATFDFVCLPPPPSIATSDIRVLHTAVRIGVLLATKTGYRYLRGDPLAADDLCRHCRQIDVDFEHTPVATLAEMLAGSFRRARPLAWRVVPSFLDLGEDEVRRRWEITVCHSGELEGEVSTLPLCLCWGKEEWGGEVVPRSLLDVILLQNRGSGEGNVCVRLSREEGRSFWKDGQEEEGRCDDVGLEYATGSSSKEDTGAMPSQPLPLTEQASPPMSGVHVRTERRPNRNNGTRMATRWPNRGQETVMYAQGIKTSIAGSKRKKKAKFTLGSL